MNDVIMKLENLMNTNINKCNETFSNYYQYGNHKSS